MNDYTKMGNEEIGEFCLMAGRKLAKDVHTVATAIKVVHDRIGGKKGEFGAWREKYIPFFSKATVYRYLAIAELHPTQINENEGITELYRRLHILPAKPPADSMPTTGRSGTGTTTTVTEAAPTSNSEGVAKVEDAPSLASGIGQVVPNADPTLSSDMQSQEEDMTPKQEEDLRAMEVAAALIVAGKLAAKHGVSGEPKHLVAFLDEFGVKPGDISVLASALAAA